MALHILSRLGRMFGIGSYLEVSENRGRRRRKINKERKRANKEKNDRNHR